MTLSLVAGFFLTTFPTNMQFACIKDGIVYLQSAGWTSKQARESEAWLYVWSAT